MSRDSYFENLFKEPIYNASRKYHEGKDGNAPGKISIVSTKRLLTQNDLSLAYTPGVGAVCFDIYKDPNKVYNYTSKGNIVAVISDGSAVLGLGDIGPAASIPVMEGKSVLFKKFADIDSVPLVINERNTDEIVKIISSLSDNWGGINLEDFSAPRCFEIERKLQEKLDIPVFHDDQHGTAIVAGAGLLNALDIAKKKIDEIKMVVCGAGAAGIACIKFFITLGVKKENITVVDRDGVVYKGREESMDPIKAEFMIETEARSLMDAIKGANVFVGLSAAGALTGEMLEQMAPHPIIFAMANPEPEIRPEIAKSIRSDVMIATGRSDYPNQINNVMGFPYIFRGALDVRATKINDEMKMAAAHAIAALAKEPVHDNVFTAYSGRNFEYGPEYILPVPFDPRLLTHVTVAVAKAAMDSGVARKKIEDLEAYKMHLNSKLDPTINLFQLLHEKVKSAPRKVIFAEGEEEKVIRAACQWGEGGYGQAILVGDQDTIEATMAKIGIKGCKNVMITNSALCPKDHLERYINYFYNKNCRKGILKRDAIRDVKIDRNIFASCMLACGDADAMITGVTRNYYDALKEIKRIIDAEHILFGLSGVISKGRTIFISDSAIHGTPSSEELAEITIKAAKIVSEIGYVPRAALLSYATFGNPYDSERAGAIRKTAEILRNRADVDFEWDGEMSAEVALNSDLLTKYPFTNLTGPANLLIMPGLHSADISQKMIKSLTDAILVGPILIGLKHSVQLVSMNASVAEILNMAALAAARATNFNRV